MSNLDLLMPFLLPKLDGADSLLSILPDAIQPVLQVSLQDVLPKIQAWGNKQGKTVLTQSKDTKYTLVLLHFNCLRISTLVIKSHL